MAATELRHLLINTGALMIYFPDDSIQYEGI